MQGALRFGAIVAVIAMLTGPARAQDAPAEAEVETAAEAEVEAEGQAPVPTDVAAAEELPDGADSGPAILVPRRELSPEEARRERERNFDPTEPHMPGVFQLSIGVGAALDSSLDSALTAHRYGDSPLIVLGDVSFLGRVTEWLYVGGRLGGRGRGWGSNDTSPAVAGAIDVMAIAHLRAYLGRIVDIGAVLGLGVGWAGLTIQGAAATGLAPRLHGSAVIAFRLGPGVRITARFGWDWFSLYDLDRYGSDLELGGPSLSLGFEVRR
ncbi:MAG: hypothetical protein M3Y87_34330 [Myxococcota bacterium]|nr:hypothetical protein [Myxococcota bacterium]